jgi:hypothetical protein
LPRQKFDELYKLEMYNSRGLGDRQAFCDLLVINNSGTIYLASLIGEKKNLEQMAFLFQESKVGRIYRAEGRIFEKGHLRRSVYAHDKKNRYDEYQTKIDDVTHMLLVSKSAQPSTKERQEWELAQERVVKNGGTPPNLPDEFAELILSWDGEWKDYIVDILIQKGWYKPLNVYCFGSDYQLEAGLLTISEFQLERIITEGIASYELDFAIMEDGRTAGVLDKCQSLDDYLTHFAGELGERIQKNVRVRFDPQRDQHHPAFYDVNLHANKQGLTGLFPPQADAVMGVANTLKEEKYSFVIGEMGVGKTAIGAVAPYISQAVIHNTRYPKPYRAIVFCPAIMVEKWKREIKERIPNCEVYEITHWTDVLKLKNKPYRPEKIEYYIMSSELPKHTYPKTPIKDWRVGSDDLKAQMALYEKQMIEAAQNGTSLPKAPRIRFIREEHRNYDGSTYIEFKLGESGFRCPSCGGPLTAERGEIAGPHFFEQRVGRAWQNKIKAINYVCKNTVKTKHLPKHQVIDPTKEEQKCGFVLWQPERLPLDSKLRKISPAWAINKFLRRGFFTYLIADEVHEYRSDDTAVGKALGQLINHTEKQILLTGTLIGGMASDVFYLLARLDAKKLLKESITYEDESLFIKRYGVFEKKFKNEDGRRKSTGRNKRPGISPHLFPLYLMGNCVFLELADLGYALPPYQEIPVFVNMDQEHRVAYDELEKEIGGKMRQNSFLGGMKYVSTYINAMYQFADTPWNIPKLVAEDESGNEILIAEPLNLDPDVFTPEKFYKLHEILDREIYQEKRKVLVYVKYTGASAFNQVDIYLYEKLKSLGYRVGVLRSSGSYDGIKMPSSSKDREAWLKEMMEQHDWDVLITNPRLVKVGLDLLQFPTIVYYQMDYSCYDYMQSSRRSWRIKQTQPVRVYTLVYQDTIQSDVLEIIAKKIDAAMAMQGKFSEEGLRAMSESDDGMNALAKKLLGEGKLDHIETIHERFQRLNQSYEEMQSAKYEDYEHYEVNPIEGGIETVMKIARGFIKNLEDKVSTGVVTPNELLAYMEKFDEMIKIIEDAKSFNKGARKKERVVEGQIALALF